MKKHRQLTCQRYLISYLLSFLLLCITARAQAQTLTGTVLNDEKNLSPAQP
ncbi:hypothetical protein ACQ86N_28725 [Puia sp. P3]|uniref:hypothetical protein n=1 Tax=Puia sp. P3 TaxID=3423952 RepID=UPI003D67FC67